MYALFCPVTFLGHYLGGTQSYQEILFFPFWAANLCYEQSGSERGIQKMSEKKEMNGRKTRQNVGSFCHTFDLGIYTAAKVHET